MKSKKPDYFTLILFGGAGILLIIFLALHAGMVDNGNYIGTTIDALGAILNNPLEIRLTSSFFKYLLIYSGMGAIVVLYLYVENEKNKRIDKEPGGKAKWYENLNHFKKLYTDTEDKFNNMILTQNVALNMDSFKTKRNNNILVVGGSGSGKTRYMIKPNIMQANCSYVITDPKGEILQSEGEMLKKHGYKIKVFNLTDMAHSNSYNPFEYIRDDLGVLMMINCLIKNTNNGQKGGDPFWEKSETALLQALVFYLKDNKDLDDKYKNFTNVMKLLQAAEVNENDPNAQSPLDKLFAKVEAENPNSLAVKQYKIFKMGAGKTLKSILISCGVRLTVFNLHEIENLTMKDDLDLASVGDEKTALFVVIPAADDTYNFLVSMMYSQLFETLYYRAENECPYEYYIKNGKDVLAIQRKNEKGDKYTKRDAKRLLDSLKRAQIKTVSGKMGQKKYVIKARNFTKEFYTREDAEKYKTQLQKAEIVKGAIRLPYQVRFLLDEFANIGQIPDFTKKLATMRQYGISCTIILQNLAQIKTMYKDDWESIVGNCDSFLFLGGQEYSTLEYISKLLGKKTIVNRGKGRSKSAKGGNSSQNDSQQGVNLMDPSDIANMPKDECILIINGLNPFYDKKYDLTKHPNYKETGDSKEGKSYDYKREIFNYGLLEEQKKQRSELSKEDKDKGLEAYVEGPGKPLNEVFREEKINSVKDAVERVVLKKGEVIVNEKTDPTTGETEFDYNIE